MPACTASSTTYWISGLSTNGSISLGCALVAGRKRVPSPAAGKTALRICIIFREAPSLRPMIAADSSSTRTVLVYPDIHCSPECCMGPLHLKAFLQKRLLWGPALPRLLNHGSDPEPASSAEKVECDRRVTINPFAEG